MEGIKTVEICKSVLTRLAKMDFELKGKHYAEQLIFPNKEQAKGDIKRISEQELCLLFVEEFKKANKDLFYSIETPTQAKYKFGDDIEKVGVYEDGQSALLDMCVFKRDKEGYNRILNIEFKHKNAALKNIAKDVLKLAHEEQNGAFVFLLKNTNKGTLCNKTKTGVFDKLSESFKEFKDEWEGNKEKHIQLIILSLEQKTNNTGTPFLIHRTIWKDDLSRLENLLEIDDLEDKPQE